MSKETEDLIKTVINYFLKEGFTAFSFEWSENNKSIFFTIIFSDMTMYLEVYLDEINHGYMSWWRNKQQILNKEGSLDFLKSEFNDLRQP